MSSVTPFPQHTNATQIPLPVDWYISPEIYAAEQQLLFAKAPKYAGHQLMVPNKGDFHALDWMGNAKALVNQNNEISLLSNVCRHRQAIMLKGRGNTKNIVCPLHRWTYDLDGALLGAPRFEKKPCLNLNKTALKNWQGLLFEQSHDIARELDSLGCKQHFDFTNYNFDNVLVEHYDFNWKTFIEAYLEDYHVGPFHPGLNQFVDCNNLHWNFGNNFSVQTVGYRPMPEKNLSQAYKNWQQAVTQYHGTHLPKHGAIWFVYYPYLMIEWYPSALVVSHLIPTGVDTCSNVVEFYYPEDIALFEREYVKAQQAAYIETAIEDKEICQRMHDGRKALSAQGIEESGPYQQPLEAGLEHFHLWYRRQMQQHL
jgi:choline monooxygenase